MILKEEKRNLFEVDLSKYTLAHCISFDCAMGAGIAKIFNEKYPNMKPYLKRVLEASHLSYPVTIVYTEEDECTTAIFNLITKEKYWHKPTYDTITQAIIDMRDICKTCEVKYVAMPKIGCGLDKLEWSNVKMILEVIFKDLDIEILVCSL